MLFLNAMRSNFCVTHLSLLSFHNFFTGLASENGPPGNKHCPSPCGTGWGDPWQILSCEETVLSYKISKWVYIWSIYT